MAAIGLRVVEPPCRKCCGQQGVHYMTCPVVNLPPGFWARILDEYVIWDYTEPRGRV